MCCCLQGRWNSNPEIIFVFIMSTDTVIFSLIQISLDGIYVFWRGRISSIYTTNLCKKMKVVRLLDVEYVILLLGWKHSNREIIKYYLANSVVTSHSKYQTPVWTNQQLCVLLLCRFMFLLLSVSAMTYSTKLSVSFWHWPIYAVVITAVCRCCSLRCYLL